MRQYYTEVKVEQQDTCWTITKKIFSYLVTKPFDIWRDLMIPISEEGVWRRNYAAVAPIVGYFTCLAYTKELDLRNPYLLVALFLCLVLGLFIRLMSYRNTAPQRPFLLLLLFSFGMSIFWIWATA